MIKSVSKTKYDDKFAIALYKDQGKWVAHNLSIDIVATSKKKSEALEELQELTINQINFAINNGMPEAINHPAPTRFWQRICEKMTAHLVGDLFRKSNSSSELKKVLRRSPVYDLTSPPSRRLA